MSTPEFELLLASARTAPDADRIQQLVRSRIDWKTLWQLATHYNVRPLVCRSMQMVFWGDVPEQSQQEWQNDVRILSGRNFFLLGELITIILALEAAGIQVWVLKGLLYGQILYDDVTLRETNDFDLLIRESDFVRTAGVLKNLGYEPQSSAKLDQFPELLKYVGEYTFVGREKHVDIDLHWRLSNKPLALAPDPRDFPLSPQKFSLAGSIVQSIAIEELPLYLATQGGNDSWDDLRRIADLAEYLRRYPETDWLPIIAATRLRHAEYVLIAGLQLAVRFFGATLPAGLAEELRLADGKLGETIGYGMEQRQTVSAMQRHVFQIQAKSGITGKAKLFCAILTDRMKADIEWLPLPRPLWWLYRVLRPIRMLLTLGNSE